MRIIKCPRHLSICIICGVVAMRRYLQSTFSLLLMVVLQWIVSCTFTPRSIWAQEKVFAVLLREGKAEFFKGEEAARTPYEDGMVDSARARYRRAVEMLEQAVELNPISQEAYYFLAYAYDREAAPISPGDSLRGKTLQTTVKISRALERALAISPYYSGEIYIIDPYEKLNSAWGSLAFAYALRGDLDSARWAFQEGRRVGGFRPYKVEFCRNLLSSCEKDAILLVNGDGDTFPMWYVQFIEGYRQDVTLVNISLSNIPWYVRNLMTDPPFSTNMLAFSYTSDQLDTINMQWITQPMKVSVALPEVVAIRFGLRNEKSLEQAAVSWEVPGRMIDTAHALWMQHYIIIDLLKSNQWKRPIYFSNTIDGAAITDLGLEEYLLKTALAYRIMPLKQKQSRWVGAMDYSVMQTCLMSLSNTDIASLVSPLTFNNLTDRIDLSIEDCLNIIMSYRVHYTSLAQYELRERKDSNAALKTLYRMEQFLPSTIGTIPYPQSAEIADLYYMAGEKQKAAFYAKMTIKAVDALGKDWESNPYAFSHNPIQLKAQALSYLGEYDKAIKLYQEEYPNDPTARGYVDDLRVEKFLSKNDTAGAVAELKTMITEYEREDNAAMQENLEALRVRLGALEATVQPDKQQPRRNSKSKRQR
jgi:tetratricopeptide (TPR) repeat protein